MNNQLKIRLVKYYIYSYFLYHLQKNIKDENVHRYESKREKITNLALL